MLRQIHHDGSSGAVLAGPGVAGAPSPSDVASAVREAVARALPETLTWLLATVASSVGTRLASRRADDVAPSATVRVGDRAEFQRLVLPQLDAAYSFARFLSRDAEAAQDIVQDAFLRAYRSFGTFHGASPRAWLFAIVRNCHQDWQLARRRTARIEVECRSPTSDDDVGSDLENVASDEDTPETTLIRATESQRVRRVLLRLQQASREILVLRELEELSYREIAEVAGLPIGTVMSRLARARREFADEWSRTELSAEARR